MMVNKVQSKRLLVIGGIHGYLDKLQGLMEQVRPALVDKVIFLGDYIDRGPDSKGVIEYLVDFRRSFPQTVFLRGNHEQMLLDAMDEDREAQARLMLDLPPNSETKHKKDFIANGGQAALDSYGATFDEIPAEHTAFMEACPYWHREVTTVPDGNCGTRSQEFIFVHAGIRPGIPLEKQDTDDLLWIRDEFLTSKDNFGGAIVVHGHTFDYEEAPVIRPNRIGMDNGVHMDPRISHYFEAMPGNPGQLVCCDLISRQYWRQK